MASNKGFSYTKDEGKNIIVEETLLDLDLEPTQTADSRKLFFDLHKLSEKELKIHINMVYLSDYWKKDMIPQGLRINKFPSFGHSNDDFREKWEAILNKCSQDLMLLLIEEAKKQKLSVQTQIEELKAQLLEIETEEHRLPFEKKLKEDMDKLSLKLKQGKVRKYKRDLDVYSSGAVYEWGKKRNHRHRRVSFNLPSTDDDDDDDEVVGDTDNMNDYSRAPETHHPNHFLESRPRQHSQPYRRGRGKRGGAGGDGHQPRPNTRSQSRPPRK